MSPPTTTFILALFAVAFALWVGVFAYTILDLNKRVRKLEGLVAAVKAELAEDREGYKKNEIRWMNIVTGAHAERDQALSRVRELEEALRYIAESHDWGKDTALRRSISDLQDCARKALGGGE